MFLTGMVVRGWQLSQYAEATELHIQQDPQRAASLPLCLILQEVACMEEHSAKGGGQ